MRERGPVWIVRSLKKHAGNGIAWKPALHWTAADRKREAKNLGRRVRRVDVHAALGQIDYAAQFDVNVQLFRAVIHRGRCEQ
jgi:hypothetical protein